MENFFKKLKDCERVILRQDASMQTNQGCALYSDLTKKTTRRLIAFVESGDFTKAKSSKFIARNFRHSSQELADMWEEEFGKAKSYHTVRSQVSTTSLELYELFGTTFAEDLIRNEPKAISDMLDALEVGNCYFSDLFPAELDRRIGTDDISNAIPCALTREFAFLNRYRKDKFEHDFKELDMHGLACIKQAINEPLVIDHVVNYNKVAYLQELNAMKKTTEDCPQNIYIHPTLTSMFMENTDKGLSGVDTFRKDELKRLFYTMYTKKGLTELLQNYSAEEVTQAVKEVKEGI